VSGPFEKIVASIISGSYVNVLIPSGFYIVDPVKVQTTIRIRFGAPEKTHLELHQLGFEQFLETLRFEQRGILEEWSVTLR
jgi:hypothetical protein